MFDMTQQFNDAVKNPEYWENGEICFGDIHNRLFKIAERSGVDQADFEFDFIVLEEKYNNKLN